MERKTKEVKIQSEEALNELTKQREQLAAKLQLERRNTIIRWQEAMSVKHPTLLVGEENSKLIEELVEKEMEITRISNENSKLREELVKKEKEITRITKQNKELKVCWKDSAKLLKDVWKQFGDETNKIEDAVKRRHH